MTSTTMTSNPRPHALSALAAGGAALVLLMLWRTGADALVGALVAYFSLGAYGTWQLRLTANGEKRLALALALAHALALAVLASASALAFTALAAYALLSDGLIHTPLTRLERAALGFVPLLGVIAGTLSAPALPLDASLIAGGVLLVGMGISLWREGPSTTTAPSKQVPARPDDSANSEVADVEALATRLGVTVDGLVRATQAINAVTTQQSSSATEQAEVIQLANQMLDGFLQLSERISEQARSVTETAQEAADISGQGQRAIEQAIDGMEAIRVQVEAIGASIATLARLTQRIDAIITSVSEIATQSNLLALNASIEAARAGVHGRGFAIVADEVRSLAGQSTQSAGQVRAILSEIQQAMKETIRATQEGIQGVDAGVARTREANAVILQLSGSVNASRTAVKDIYGVIRQQADGLEEIAISMDRIDRITQQNLASTRTVETVSANLTRLASELESTVGAAT